MVTFGWQRSNGSILSGAALGHFLFEDYIWAVLLHMRQLGPRFPLNVRLQQEMIGGSLEEVHWRFR